MLQTLPDRALDRGQRDLEPITPLGSGWLRTSLARVVATAWARAPILDTLLDLRSLCAIVFHSDLGESAGPRHTLPRLVLRAHPIRIPLRVRIPKLFHSSRSSLGPTPAHLLCSFLRVRHRCWCERHAFQASLSIRSAAGSGRLSRLKTATRQLTVTPRGEISQRRHGPRSRTGCGARSPGGTAAGSRSTLCVSRLSHLSRSLQVRVAVAVTARYTYVRLSFSTHCAKVDPADLHRSLPHRHADRNSGSTRFEALRNSSSEAW